MTLVVVGADHAGFALKEKLKQYLQSEYAVLDLGAHSLIPDDDYPDYAHRVCDAVVQRKAKGLLFCGSAEGMCIAANKVNGIRAIAASSVLLAKLSREHEDANVLCIPGGKTKEKHAGLGMSKEQALRVIAAWLHTAFSGAVRHKRRIKKIQLLER